MGIGILAPKRAASAVGLLIGIPEGTSDLMQITGFGLDSGTFGLVVWTASLSVSKGVLIGMRGGSSFGRYGCDGMDVGVSG